MLDTVFLKILNMSYTSCYVILAVLLVRLLLKKAPKSFSYALWSVALFRLVCPWSFESALSLLSVGGRTAEQLQPFPRQFAALGTIRNKIDTNGAGTTLSPVSPIPEDPIFSNIFTLIWLLGITALLIYSIVLLIKLRKQLHGAVLDTENIYLSAHLNTPFVMGVIHPKIYLPMSLTGTEKRYILLHEQTHIRRFDHMIKLVSFFVLCVHWFNPFVWVAFFLSSRDMEMSCDEAVIKTFGNEVKKEYSSSLLSLSTGRQMIGGTPLAFGEGDTKSRIKNVLNYRKPAFWIIALCIIVVAAVCSGLALNPKSEKTSSGYAESLWSHRTSYIGDNSAVGNIIGALDFPEDTVYDSFELHSSERPYALTIYLKTDSETRNDDSGAIRQTPFQVNACILFSLIENMDSVTFCLDDGVLEPSSLEYTAHWAEGIVDANLWEESKTLGSFKDLLTRINEQVSIAMAPSEDAASKREFIDPLEEAISNAILAQEKDASDSEFVCESHVTLATEGRSSAANSNHTDMLTVYAMVLIQKYNDTEKGLVEVGGSHIPTAITFNVSESGEYTLKEYWVPRDGSYYVPDIKKKFPSAIWNDALDTQKYILAQIQNCYAQAIKYKQLDTVPIIDNLFETLMSSPANSSHPGDYIDAHRLEYRELTYYGDDTLRYVFSEFLKGGQTGLKGHLMWIVMDDLIASEAMPMAAENGQAYFDAWREQGQKKRSSIGEDEMRNNYPKTYLMLTMLSDME